jgi:SpoIID/LytB domain protein
MRALPRRTAVLASALMAAAVLAPAGAGAARTRQVFPVPAAGEFTITGHGYGHGRGMSQYGAQGAAKQGLTARQILAFYYPGTAVAQFTGYIRVLITADTTRDVQVRARPGLSVRDRGTGRVYRLPTPTGVTKWRLNVVGKRAVVGFYRNGWHPYLLSGRRYLVGDGEFLSRTHTLALVTPHGTKNLRGTLRAASPTRGSTDRDTVNVLRLENYLRGVVPDEMPALWMPAAVQAQAVAARTYALFKRAANLNGYYQICDTTACQVYGGLDAEHPAADRAIAATAGQYLTYGGKPAFTEFSSSSGGWTAAGDFAYLPARQDPYDDFAGNHVHDWSVDVKEAVLEKRYPQLGELTAITVTARDGNGEWGGRVQAMTLIGTTGSVKISGNDFRFLYRLRSTWFTLTPPTAPAP